MGCSTDAEGWTLVRCTNVMCRSNRLVDATAPVKDLNAAIEILGGATGLEKTNEGREVLQQMRRIFDPAPKHPSGWDAIKSAMFAGDLREIRGSSAWCEVFAVALREADARQDVVSTTVPVEDSPQALLEGFEAAEAKPFAIVRDRFVDGDLDLAVRQSDGLYLFSDGDLHKAEGDMLGMWEAEFFSQYELEKRLTRLAVHSTN